MDGLARRQIALVDLESRIKKDDRQFLSMIFFS